jgi:hypothetical protein
MQAPRTTAKPPTGLSFEIPDLLMLQAWMDFHDLRMEIDLDVVTDGEEYEELLGLYDRNRAVRQWRLWRTRVGMMVQPAMGPPMRFDSMVDVLDLLIPARD